MRHPKYQLNDRVSFMAVVEEVHSDFIQKTLKSFAGYIKQVRRSIFGTRYVIFSAKADRLYIVPKRDVLGIIEKKEVKPQTETIE